MMADLDDVKHYKDSLQFESLLKDSRGNEDEVSSDGDSTVVASPSWKKEFLNQSDYRLFGKRTMILLMTGLCGLLMAILFILVWLLSLRHSHHYASDATLDLSNRPSYFPSQTIVSSGIRSCGSSSSEAIAAGCHFDTFSFGWTPPECTDIFLYNMSISTLRTQAENSPIFFTPNHDILPFSALEDYATGNSPPGAAVTDHHEIYSTWEHYLTGCAYGWQKVQRAAMRGWPLEEWSTKYALAKRCGPDMLQREKQESESVFLHLKPWFPACGLTAEDMRREIAASGQN